MYIWLRRNTFMPAIWKVESALWRNMAKRLRRNLIELGILKPASRSLRHNTSYGYAVKYSKPINRGLIQTLRHHPIHNHSKGRSRLPYLKEFYQKLWFRWISFECRVTLGFGNNAGGLDHVSPVIILPIEHEISRELGNRGGSRHQFSHHKAIFGIVTRKLGTGVVKSEIGGNVNFKIKSQFMRELREDTFSGNKNKDVHDHIDRVLSIWHDETMSWSIGSNSNNDGLAAIVSNLDNLRRDMKKLKENVHAIQVGCQICEGPRLEKDCPLSEEIKKVEEVKYEEFG
ncbi:hypothetical protein Tco_0970335 [Tanacetum coccineum]